MHWRGCATIICAAFLFAAPAGASTADRQGCDLDVVDADTDFWAGPIAACTRVIDDEHESPKNRSCAHFRRGHFHWLKQDQPVANADLGQAIRLDPGNAAAYGLRAWTSDDSEMSKADLDKWAELGGSADCRFE